LKKQKRKLSFETDGPIIEAGKNLKEEVKSKGLGLRMIKTTNRPDSPMKRMQAKFSKSLKLISLDSVGAFGGLKMPLKKVGSDTSLSYDIQSKNSENVKNTDRAFEKLFTIDESSFLGEVSKKSNLKGCSSIVKTCRNNQGKIFAVKKLRNDD